MIWRIEQSETGSINDYNIVMCHDNKIGGNETVFDCDFAFDEVSFIVEMHNKAILDAVTYRSV